MRNAFLMAPALGGLSSKLPSKTNFRRPFSPVQTSLMTICISSRAIKSPFWHDITKKKKNTLKLRRESKRTQWDPSNVGHPGVVVSLRPQLDKVFFIQLLKTLETQTAVGTSWSRAMTKNIFKNPLTSYVREFNEQNQWAMKEKPMVPLESFRFLGVLGFVEDFKEAEPFIFHLPWGS